MGSRTWDVGCGEWGVGRRTWDACQGVGSGTWEVGRRDGADWGFRGTWGSLVSLTAGTGVDIYRINRQKDVVSGMVSKR